MRKNLNYLSHVNVEQWREMEIYVCFPLEKFSMLRVNSIFVEDRDQLILHSYYHGCWCHGDTRRQGISSHSISLVYSAYLVNILAPEVLTPVSINTFLALYTPPLQQSWKGGTLVSPCPSVDRIVSALYLQQYSSDPFHICTSYQATSEGVSQVKFVSKFTNLKFWQIL